MHGNSSSHNAAPIASNCAAPTHKSERYTSSQLHPSASEIDRGRYDIHTRLPKTAIGALNQCLCNLFAGDDLVKAYQLHVGSMSPAGISPVMPLDLCERASDPAGTYAGLLHNHERDLASVAAFVQFCGLYWCARQQALGGHPVQVAVSSRTYRSRIKVAQRGLLQEPLRQLRRSHQGLGRTLAQVLGIDGDSDVDAQQVARIQAALGTTQMQVH